MKTWRIFVALACLAVFFTARPALAWDDAGHKIVAYIAWQQMSPAAREKAVKLLLSAPEETHLQALYPTPPDLSFTTYPAGARSKESKQRDFFMICAYWADIIRDPATPKRSAFHRGTWHYYNSFWRQTNSGVEFLNLPNNKENAVERLYFFDKLLRSGASDSDKGVALAWILHIAGDIHQPLHASGRVTDTEPEGDQGGNLFLLSPPNAKQRENLHWWWDSIVVRTVPRRADASDADYLLPLAASMMKKTPKAAVNPQPGKFDTWHKESLQIAIDKVYPASLKRGEMPSNAYQQAAFGIAERQLAIAGYRLGAWLEDIFSQPSMPMADAANKIPCRMIRTVTYPVSKTRTPDQKPTPAVIDLCPANKGMVARPMMSFFINGTVLDFEYDVVKVFKTDDEARAYGAANGITDIVF